MPSPAINICLISCPASITVPSLNFFVLLGIFCKFTLLA
nr:MAG TPA: hypothetical protein [Caudoviricetes sp.]